MKDPTQKLPFDAATSFISKDVFHMDLFVRSLKLSPQEKKMLVRLDHFCQTIPTV